jgi:hypothetical protein
VTASAFLSKMRTIPNRYLELATVPQWLGGPARRLAGCDPGTPFPWGGGGAWGQRPVGADLS